MAWFWKCLMYLQSEVSIYLYNTKILFIFDLRKKCRNFQNYWYAPIPGAE